MTAGWLETARDGDRLVVNAGGAWVVGAAGALDQALRQLDAGRARTITLDMRALDAIDTTGAFLLIRTQQRLAEQGVEVVVSNLPSDYAPLFRQIEEACLARPVRDPEEREYTFTAFLARLGLHSVNALRRGYNLLGFFGLVCVTAARTLRHPSRLRVIALLAQMEKTGVDALPLVGLLSFLIGIVFAYQGADQLRRFGAEIYTVNLLGLAILRELGGMLTAILVTGRSGSAFTAQIGTMKVNEEVDAMRTLGLDPIEILVLPRLFALILVLPLLTFYANVMGLLGGALMSWVTLDISIPVFLRQLRTALIGWTFWLGLVKAPVFAVIIAMSGCYEGLRAARSAESVGRLTTVAVVESIFLIILSDALFSILFSLLGI